jgi:hypothetical protein
MLRNALWAVLGSVAFLTVACADGAEEPKGAAGSTADCPASCGNGVLETANLEVCENVLIGTMPATDPATPTCDSMGMGKTGLVTCNACCMWDFEMCLDPGGGGVGGGNGSLTAGTGGVGGS